MAFDLSVIRDGVTYSLSAGTPFSLVSAQGLAYPAVQRTTMRAPAQDGDVDYGYVLEPRTVTLSLQILATSGSALDTHRDTLYDIFRPARTASFSNPTGDPRIQAETPLTLQVTRDDGEVRRLDCYVAGPLDVPLVAAHHAGNLHRAAVQLVAPNPTWYGTANVSTSFSWINSGTPILGTIAYAGGYFAYPVYSLGGGIVGPVITNVQTGASLNFGSVTIGTVPGNLVIDTFSGYAEFGSAVMPTGSLDISGLYIAPNPVVTGGTNVIRVTASSSGGDAAMSVSYRPRYLSY